MLVRQVVAATQLPGASKIVLVIIWMGNPSGLYVLRLNIADALAR